MPVRYAQFSMMLNPEQYKALPIRAGRAQLLDGSGFAQPETRRVNKIGSFL